MTLLIDPLARTPAQEGGMTQHETPRERPKEGGAESERIDVDALLAACDAARDKRASKMPDAFAALVAMQSAFQRLCELGWQDIMYCPKDGTVFDCIEPGSVGIHKCHYDGEWPFGHWWVEAGGDLWPSRPILFRLVFATPQEQERG